MTDPTRLLDEGGTSLEVRLLGSGKAEGPPPASIARALAFARESASARKPPVVSRRSVSRWIVMGVAGLALLGVAMVLAKRSPSIVEPAPPPPVVGAATPVEHAVASVESSPWVSVPGDPIAPSSLPAAAPVVAPRGSHAVVAPPAPSVLASSEPIDDAFAAELRAIEQVQRSVTARHYADALGLLDDWAVRFPRKHFDEEAAVLRIEALSGRGDREQSHRLAQQFLATHPASPLSQRVRSLLHDP
jgi:hypothetical protein